MKTARTVLVAAAVLGLLGDYLFHDSLFKLVPWGLNLFVWLLTITVASLILTCRTKPTSQWKSAWFLVPPLFLAAGCVWRESVVLRCLDIAGIIFFLSAASLSMTGTKMVTAGISQYLNTVINTFESLVTTPILLLTKEAGWSTMIDDRIRAQIKAVCRGLVIAVPILTIFSVLLITADAAFASVVKNSFKFDPVQSFQHGLLALSAFWWAGGYLFGPLSHSFDASKQELTEEKKMSLGVVEVGVVLGLIDLLFLAFVVVQAKYFFGGANLVELTSGMTYAEYARRGFFELVTVASLVLPILLALDWLVEKTSAVGTLLIRSLTGIQIALLSVIMISAVQRMRLYQCEYGLTELRLYTTAFMAWLALVCLVFVVTVLRGRRRTFAFSSVMSGLLVVSGLHFINPDALIVTTNIDHSKEGSSPFDVKYALSLSNDAVPPLITQIDQLKASERQEVVDRFRMMHDRAWKTDWRSWSLSGSIAFHAVNKYLDKLNRPVPVAKYRRVDGPELVTVDGAH